MTPPADTPEIDRKVAAQLGQRLLKILAPMRVRSLSLHDVAGELLWINHGEYDEHMRRQVQEAQDAFALDRNLQHLERDVEGSRVLFFCSRSADGDRAGLAFAIVSSRRRPDVDPAAVRERVFTSMRRFSASEPLPAGVVDGRPPEPEPTPALGGAMEDARARTEQTTDDHPDSLRSRPYARLRPGGTTRRYEIADSAEPSTEQDLIRAARLIALLKRRGARNAPAPASFALPLCAASILSGQFTPRLEPMLHEAHLSEDILGFTLPPAAWELDPAATERFMEQCAAMRCFVALDDFNLARGGFALLRAPSLRCLKLDAKLIAGVPEDKFAHANVAAIVKAARILGLYCVAKAVKSPDRARWLASAGVEFADRASRAGKAGSTTRRARALRLAAGS
jgi:EAL domain-containing protein (putative c-di-GMP-specific phosphodiesterase class I)